MLHAFSKAPFEPLETTTLETITYNTFVLISLAGESFVPYVVDVRFPVVIDSKILYTDFLYIGSLGRLVFCFVTISSVVYS